MKKIFSIIIMSLSLILTSCSDNPYNVVKDKINEITNDKEYFDTNAILLKDGYYHIYVSQNDIPQGKEVYSVYFELEDFFKEKYGDPIIEGGEENLNVNDLTLIFDTGKSPIKTHFQYHDIGPKNHEIWVYEFSVFVKKE